MKTLRSLVTGLFLSTSVALAGPYAPLQQAPYLSPVAPEGGWYFGLNGGFLWLEDIHTGGLDFSFDTGWGALGSFGYDFGNGFSLGLGAGYLRGEFDSVSGFGRQLGVSADLHMVPVTLDGTYSFNLAEGFGLYLGGGLGGSWSELNVDSIEGVGVNAKGDDWGFTWNARAGVGYEVSPGLILNLGYRYVNFAEGAGDSQNLGGHMAEAGFKVRF